MIMDPQAVRAGQEGLTQNSTMVPALIDIGSAFFGALYFLISARNVKQIPICLLILIMNFHTFMLNSLIARFSDPRIQIFSVDMEFGCLGFLNFNNPLLPILSYALFASFFGSAGYVLCLLFFSPLIVSNAFLLEPFVAQTLGYIFGLDNLPGLLTILGTLAAVGGILFIDKGSRERERLTPIKDEEANVNMIETSAA